jgi:hypothetical protein
LKSGNYKIALLKSTCRQCQAAIPAKANSCPLCGIARPNFDELNSLEKEYLNNNPLVPFKHQDMAESVDPGKSFVKNIVQEFCAYFSTFSESYLLIFSLFMLMLGGVALALEILFPLSFILFWASLVYIGFDSINFMRAITVTFLVKRLQQKIGLSPYSVLFKLEAQLSEMLESLQVVVTSLFERDWSSIDDVETSSESFLKAASILTDRIKQHARMSLETAAILWRNNVYAIMAMETSLSEKAVAIGNKIREAEALILRYSWLQKIDEINDRLESHVAHISVSKEANGEECKEILEKFHLTHFGPISEDLAANFQNVPFDIPFKGRFYWHQFLPPFPLEAEEFVAEFPVTEDLFESIAQVRKLKTKLEEQMVLDCATKAISSASDGAASASFEAQELQRFQLYSKYLDVPKFNPDSEEVKDAVDKLSAEAKVALNYKREPEI